MKLLNEAPEGFLKSSETFCSLSVELQQQLCHVAVNSLLEDATVLDVNNVYEKVEEIKNQLSLESLQSVVNSVVYIFRTAVRLKFDGDQLAEQLRNSVVWTENSIESIKKIWVDKGKNLFDSPSSFVNVGRLVDIQWQVGMAVTSSTCKNLNSLYVVLALKVLTPRGQLISRSFEMSLPEFRDFSKQMKDMASTFDTV